MSFFRGIWSAVVGKRLLDSTSFDPVETCKARVTGCSANPVGLNQMETLLVTSHTAPPLSIKHLNTCLDLPPTRRKCLRRGKKEKKRRQHIQHKRTHLCDTLCVTPPVFIFIKCSLTHSLTTLACPSSSLSLVLSLLKCCTASNFLPQL